MGLLQLQTLTTTISSLGVTQKQVIDAIIQTLIMTGISSALAIVIAVPLGVLLVVTKKDGIMQCRPVNIVLGVIINIFRSVPFALLLIVAIPLSRKIVGTGIGTAGMIVPLTIAAAPFVARLIESALSDVDKGLIEASKAMGASKFQIIVKVYLRESVPALILAGAIAIVAILGFTAMASLIGGGGLGQLAVDYGQRKYKYSVIILCIAILVAITQIVQLAASFLNKKTNKKA